MFNSLANKIMVTLIPSDLFVSIRTFQYPFGTSQRFLVQRIDLESQLADKNTPTVVDKDLDNFIRFYREGDSVYIKLFWLSVGSSQKISGYAQHFLLPVSDIQKALGGATVKRVVTEGVPVIRSKVMITPDGSAGIHRFCKDKYTKRALSKFFRDHFYYGAEEQLVLFDDAWRNGLFVRSDVNSFCGGIVLHKTEAKGADGQYHKKVVFELHT